MEAAARWRTHGAWDLARDDLLAARGFQLGVGDRHGCQQRLGVGMQRILVELVAGRDLDNAPEVHHGDAVADVAHDGKIVGDEDVGEV